MPGRNSKHSSKTRLDRCVDARNPAKVRGALRKTPRAAVHNSARRSNWALTATTMLLSDMRTELIAPEHDAPRRENSGRERDRKVVVSGRPPEVLNDLSVGGFAHRDDSGYVTGIASNENHVALRGWTPVCAVRGSQGFVIHSATVGSELACAGTVRSAARCSFSSGTSLRHWSRGGMSFREA